MTFADTFNEVLEAFNKAGVRYIVVGGYAINFHGYERNTSDLDLWVEPSEENKLRILEALNRLDYSLEEVKPIEGFDFTKPFLFRIGEKPNDVEVFNFISGVLYSEADKNKILFSMPDEPEVFFISIRDLVVNKLSTGRQKDKIDVDELQKIAALRNKDK